MPSSSTVKLSDSIAFAQPFIGQFPLTVGAANVQPAATIANIIARVILGPPFAWRWNRATTGFFCTAGVQDYKLGNWAANTSFPLNYFIVDTNGNSQKVTVAGTSGGSQPSWNTNSGGTTSDGVGTLIWTNQGPIANSTSNYSFFWTETANVQDVGQTPNKWYEMTSHIDLALDTSQARPRDISAVYDDGAGTLTWRLMPVPDKAYPISIDVQQKPPLFTSLNSTWAPIPDEFSYIYNLGFLAWAHWYNNDPVSFQLVNRSFIGQLFGAYGGLTETERDIFFKSYGIFLNQEMTAPYRTQQFTSGRGL